MALRAGADLRRPAELLLEVVSLVRSSTSHDLSHWALSILDQACRQLECFVIPEVSVRAAQEALNLGLPALSTYTWHDQVSKMKDNGRKIFHWEHVVPVSEIKRRLLSPSTQSSCDVATIIRQIDIAWILKEENAILAAKGYAHRRPPDCWEAYADAEIYLLRNARMSELDAKHPLPIEQPLNFAVE